MNTRNDRATWIKGATAQCSIPPKLRLQPQRLILLGAPGIDKGTQAELLCAGLNVCHLSTDDLFRTARSLPDPEQSPAASETLADMRRDAQVPDFALVNLVRERTACLSCRGGFLLDGFPRTLSQAKALDDLLAQEQIKIDAVLNYTLPFDVIVNRFSGRRTCLGCKAVFHVTAQPPRVADICDHCGGILTQQEDDLPEAVEARILAYEGSAKPLIDHYVSHGTLRTISADGPPDRIYARTLAILDT